MKLSSFLLSAAILVLLAALAGFPALPAFAFSATAFLLPVALHDYGPRRAGYAIRPARGLRQPLRRSRRVRHPLAA